MPLTHGLKRHLVTPASYNYHAFGFVTVSGSPEYTFANIMVYFEYPIFFYTFIYFSLFLNNYKFPNFNYLCTMKEEVKLHIYKPDLSTELALPYADGGIKAGFPSPAQDYLTESIDLNKVLIRHPETTFYAKVSGDSLTNAGICDMDLAIIDRSLECQNGDYVAAYVDGEFTLKQFKLDDANNCAWLIPANEKYDPIQITEDNHHFDIPRICQ